MVQVRVLLKQWHRSAAALQTLTRAYICSVRAWLRSGSRDVRANTPEAHALREAYKVLRKENVVFGRLHPRAQAAVMTLTPEDAGAIEDLSYVLGNVRHLLDQTAAAFEELQETCRAAGIAVPSGEEG